MATWATPTPDITLLRGCFGPTTELLELLESLLTELELELSELLELELLDRLELED
jgi:hypothetical protein